MSDLADKKCIPCEGGIPSFNINEIHKYLKKVDGWDVKSDDQKTYYLLKEFKFIFIVSDDVEIFSNVEMLWGIFTRFDPSIDMYFKEVAVEKSSVTFKGQVVIDATFKDWYPNVIDMNKDVKNMVNKKWKNY